MSHITPSSSAPSEVLLLHLGLAIVFTCQAEIFRCSPRTPQGDVPLAVEPRGVTAPGSTCCAAFRVRPSSAMVRWASSALIRLFVWLQPRCLRMRVVASLSERWYQQTIGHCR